MIKRQFNIQTRFPSLSMTFTLIQWYKSSKLVSSTIIFNHLSFYSFLLVSLPFKIGAYYIIFGFVFCHSLGSEIGSIMP